MRSTNMVQFVGHGRRFAELSAAIPGAGTGTIRREFEYLRLSYRVRIKEQSDDRLRPLRRPNSQARIRERASASNTFGWPGNGRNFPLQTDFTNIYGPAKCARGANVCWIRASDRVRHENRNR
jgi:hypothetical protein